MTKHHEALATFYVPRTRACVTNHMNGHTILVACQASMVKSGKQVAGGRKNRSSDWSEKEVVF